MIKGVGLNQDKKKMKSNGEQNASSRWPFNRKGKQRSKNLETTDEPDFIGEVCQEAHQEVIVLDGCQVKSPSASPREMTTAGVGLNELQFSSSKAPSPPTYPPEVTMSIERNSPIIYSPNAVSPRNHREEYLVRELEELRAKAIQMERTMRWWSDCTANWREKWGKVRAERNRLREEVKILCGRNDVLTQELANSKRDLEDYVIENESLKHDLEKTQSEMKRLDRGKRTAVVEPHQQMKSTPQSVYESTVPKLGAELQFLEQILAENRAVVTESDGKKGNMVIKDSHSNRESFAEYEKAFGDRTRENIALKSELEELKKVVGQENQDDGERRNTDTLDSTGSGSSSKGSVKGTQKDIKLKELRFVIEKLQAENALEWEKREQVESEKLALDRETKRLRSVIEELEEEIRKKTDQVANAQTAGMKFLNSELEQKTQELLELRLAHKKCQKQLQEKTEELEHEKKRTEQYENEMRKLRSRVEELKKKLNESEEKVDNHSNSLRRLQRQHEEQCQQTDNLHSEIDHLTKRMKRQSVSSRNMIGGESNSDEEASEL